MEDIRRTKEARLLSLTPREVIRFLQMMVYLLEKLMLYQETIDLLEGVLGNEEIMTQCNPFALYYILEDTRRINALSEIHTYQTKYHANLKARFFELRL